MAGFKCESADGASILGILGCTACRSQLAVAAWMGGCPGNAGTELTGTRQ